MMASFHRIVFAELTAAKAYDLTYCFYERLVCLRALGKQFMRRIT